jgi:hypothetical protein
MFEFFSFSEKAKYQYRKLMEKFIEEKYISYKSSEKVSSFHENLSGKHITEAVS